MLKYLLLCLILNSSLRSITNAQNLASSLTSADICIGRSKLIDCTTSIKNTQSIVFTEQFYGVQKQGTTTCGYNPGDCVQDVIINICGYNKTTCTLQASSRTLSKCNKAANYLRVNYYCVPYTHPSVKTVDICSDETEITSENGFIVSPGYPTFKIQNQSCTLKVKVPVGKSINIWAVDMALHSRNPSGNCQSSYVKITDNTGIFDLCASERLALTNKFCSNVIYISYQAAEPAANNIFRGFKLYYETYDVSQSGCSTQTPAFPTITPIGDSTTSPTLINNQGSPTYNFKLCKSDPALTISAPVNYFVIVESLSYGVPSSATCEPYNPLHCLTPAPIECTARGSCTFRLGSINISSCGNLQAQYLYGTYRFIPIQSTNTYKMCDAKQIDIDSVNYAVLTSRNYSTWEPYVDCKLTIKSANPSKSIRFYLTDINIEEDDYYFNNENCENEFVSLTDGITSLKHCGYLLEADTLSYTTCTNNLTIQYKTLGQTSFSYIFDGFRAYFEITDRPSNCKNIINDTTVFTTTTTNPSLTTTGRNDSVFSSVIATDSNGAFKRCVFPFKYKNQLFRSCINLDQSEYWCSLTDDFDRDNKRGKCSLGLTEIMQVDICTGLSRRLSCPVGYGIYVISGEYVITSDSSCDYSKRKCSSSAIRTASLFCNGYEYCDYYGQFNRISTCSNSESDLTHIDYRCIPSNVNILPVYEFCSTSSITNNYGFIQTPSYPSGQKNLNCSIKFNTNSRKHISVYAIKVFLANVNSGQECFNYWVQVNDGNKHCGVQNSVLIYEGCTTEFEAKILIGATAYQGAKLFYEAREIIDESVCPSTTQSTFYPASTTQPGVLPIWAQQVVSSPLYTLNMCLTGKTIECPTNYTISIRRAFYGISYDQYCFYAPTDCVSYESISGLECAGKKTCFAPYTIKRLPECNFRQSNYIQIEYDCIPDNYPTTSICGANLNGQTKGGLTNPSYPKFDTNLNCVSTVKVKSDSIIKVYLKDLDIDDNFDCSAESITISSDYSISRTFCGDVASFFALETCTNELNITFKTSANAGNKRGVSLYYEEIPKPFDLDCGRPKTTTIRPSTTTTTKTTTTVTNPSYFGFASSQTLEVGCAKKSIYCPDGYIIAVESSYYGVKNKSDNYCSYDPSDCFGAFDKAATTCAGNRDCLISFASFTSVVECSRKYADYFLFTYQCVPTTNAGKPPKPNIDLCSPIDPASEYSVAPGSSAIFQSYNFPTYPNITINCSTKISIQDGYKLKVFLNSAKFRGSATPNCSKNTDYVVITDGFETFKYCNFPPEGRYLMQSQSNWIQIDYAVTALTYTAPFYKGFQLYVESYTTHVPVSTPGVPLTVQPVAYEPGFASNIAHDEICTGNKKILSCPQDYIAIFHEEHLVETDLGCAHSDQECKQPYELVTNECTGKQTCNIYFPETEILRCNSKYADFLDYEYQCIPTRNLLDETKVYTCNDESVSGVRNGFVQSPNYPQPSVDYDCVFNITPPAEYGLKFYVIDLSLKNTNPDYSDMDYVSIDDTQFFTSTKPQLAFYSTDSNTVSVRFKSLTQQQSGQSQDVRGFNFYFEAYYLYETTTRKPETTRFYFTAIRNKEKSSNLFNVSLGLGIPILVLLIGIILYLIKQNSIGFSGFQTRINFSSSNSNNLSSFANPNAAN